MTTGTNVIRWDASLSDAAAQLLSTDAEILWVYDGDRQVGAVTSQNLLRALMRHLDAARTPVAEVMDGKDHFAPEGQPKSGPGCGRTQGLALTDQGRLVSSSVAGGVNIDT